MGVLRAFSSIVVMYHLLSKKVCAVYGVTCIPTYIIYTFCVEISLLQRVMFICNVCILGVSVCSCVFLERKVCVYIVGLLQQDYEVYEVPVFSVYHLYK